MSLRYLTLRLIRHYTPESLARYLLKRRWIIQPGLESYDPGAAADRYAGALSENARSLTDKRVLVFGYGGRLAIGIELLKRGAAHVILCDHFVALDDERNKQLLLQDSKYLRLDAGRVSPRSEFITLVHGDIRREEIIAQIADADCVLSNSVFEHLDDVDGITAALARVTRPGGFHLHFVDLRDHYFKYPFEMLTYLNRTWTTFLNPTSNLNRWRLGGYQEVFARHFHKVDIKILERLPAEFQAVRARIRAEFLSGDSDVDCVSLIQVFAAAPHK